MRLGELLIAAGRLSPEQLEHALRAQIMWGGRLGTNLVELDLIDLDALSATLARQHRQPAALERHFANSDRGLQARLSAETADNYDCVPLYSIAATGQLVLSSSSPLSQDALAIIGEALAVERARIIVSIAAELRIRYELERAYQIKRPSRFTHRPGRAAFSFPTFSLDGADVADDEIDDAKTTIRRAGDGDDGTLTIAFQARASALDADQRYPKVSAELLPDPCETLSNLDELGAAASPEVPDHEHGTRVPIIADAEPAARQSLGRIAIHRITVARGAVERPPAASLGETLADATRAIRRARDREQVAGFAIEALRRFVAGCHAACFLVVRGQLATSWNGAGAPEVELGVPLDQPGLVSRAVATSTLLCVPAQHLGLVDRELLRVLRPEGDSLAVVPVTISGHVIAVIAMVVAAGGTPLGNAHAIAAAAGVAFARLMRDAAR